MLLLLLSCQNGTAPTSTDGEAPSAPSTAVMSRASGVVVTAPGYAARAEAAWKEAENVKLSKDGTALLTKVNTAVWADVPDEISGIDAKIQVLDIRKDEKVKQLLLGTDEAAAADAMRANGARVLIVHTALRPSMDRTNAVLSRLYNHDHLERFQLARVENGAFVYLLVDSQVKFTPEVANQAIRWVRDRLSGNNPLPFPPIKSERGNWTLVATVRGYGQELGFSLAEAPTIDRALVEIADDLETYHRRNREMLGFPPLRDQIGDMTIEIHRVTERAHVVPRDEGTLEDLFELGIDGAILLDRVGDKKQSGVWPGSVATSRGITKADSFLRGIAKDFKWDSLRPWREDETELELIRTIHYMETKDHGVVPMYRGTTVVPMEFVTQATTREAILSAGEWYLANLQPTGEVTYKFWPEENRYSDEYNHVRHTLATWNLWQAWTLDPRPEYLEGALRAQNWTLKWTAEKDGMAFMTHAGRTKLGSVVVGLLGMIETARATGDHSNDELMRKFGKFVMFMQAESGTFRGYWDPATGNFINEVNDIVPGEAALSLVYLYEYFGDEQYLKPLPKFFEYYKPWFHERAARKSEGGPWPAYTYDNATRLELVQFGPWTVMAAAAYTRVRPEAKDVSDFGLEVAKWMIDTYEYTEENAPFPDYVGGYYKFEGELPAMQAFCYAEGTAAAYDMALRMDPEQAPFFEKHTRESIRIGMQMQHDGIDSVYYSRPLEIMGGIKYSLNEPKVRIDYVHHGLSAMYQWLMASRKDPNLPAALKAEPTEAQKAVLRLQDMPSYREPGKPLWRRTDRVAHPGEVVRTSVPANAAAAVNVDIPQKEEDDGGE